MIDFNSHSIDVFLTAHILEFLDQIKRADHNFHNSRMTVLRQFETIEGVLEIMESHAQHKCLEVRIPPEITRLKT